jgi:Holliday junction resolvase RusA-like endonuclease
MIKISIPLVAPSLNKWYAGSHWSKRKKLADDWHLAIFIICKQDKIKPIITYPVTITTKSYYKKKKEMDTSNVFPANKLAEDGLVKSGILKDDTIKYVNRHIVEVPEFGHHEDRTVIIVDN